MLKNAIRAKVKDRRAIDLLFTIIDSHAPGLPIGNYISPLFANFPSYRLMTTGQKKYSAFVATSDILMMWWRLIQTRQN